MLIELHCHTSASFDSFAAPHKVVQRARAIGLGAIAVTDHDRIDGALRARDANTDPDFTVIVGEEVNSDCGDIIGLFLQQEIIARDWAGVIDEIHEQNGIALLPHPYRGHRLHDALIERVDLIEVFNARTREPYNAQARQLARSAGKTAVVGSDAHFLREIGGATIEIDGSDIKQSLLTGAFSAHESPAPRWAPSLSQAVKALKQGRYQRLPRHLAGAALRALGLKQ